MKLGIMGGAVLVLATASGAAIAADKSERTLDAFRQCGTIPDTGNRLACFDNALASIEQRIVADKKEERQRKQAEYGLRERDVHASDEPANADPNEAVAGVSSTIAEVYVQQATSRFVFVLENGQIWKQTQLSSFKGTPKPGMAVTISDGAIGGYRLKIEGKSGIIGVQRIK